MPLADVIHDFAVHEDSGLTLPPVDGEIRGRSGRRL
jgi:hypothetical protein